MAPNEKRDKGYTLYKKGLKYDEIAERLGVPLNTVKSWATRYWKRGESATKVATKDCNSKGKVATKSRNQNGKAKAKRPHPGAPPGNVNAVGNKGGAPPGNQNAVKHGGYATLWLKTLTDEERAAITGGVPDEEQVLEEEIALLSIREARIMSLIQHYSDDKHRMAVQYIQKSSDKRDFTRLDKDEEKAKADEAEFIRRQDKKVEAEERLPGNMVKVLTNMEGSYQIVERLEKILTDIQRQKAKAVSALAALRTQRDGNKTETVDAWIAAVLRDGSEGGE